jgi:hypothetical protein
MKQITSKEALTVLFFLNIIILGILVVYLQSLYLQKQYQLSISIIISIMIIVFGLFLIKRGYSRYFISYILIAAAIMLIFTTVHFEDTNLETAKYLLKSLIQCQATVFALVISFSLVALQLASSNYSARTIDLLKESIEFWALICIYIISIIFQLTILKTIDPDCIDCISLQPYIMVSYLLGIFALLSIIPYIFFILELLKPTTIILKLSKNLNLSKMPLKGRPGDKDDPFLPIIDIVSRSMSREEISTVLEGIESIKAETISILKNQKINNDIEAKLSEIISYHLERICMLISNKDDSYSADKLISSVEEIGFVAVERNLKQLSLGSIETLEKVGLQFAKKRMDIFRVVASLGRIGAISSINNHNSAASHAGVVLGMMGLIAAEQGLGGSVRQSVVSLGKLGIEAAKLDDGGQAVKNAVNSLDKIGAKLHEAGKKSAQIIRELTAIEDKSRELKLKQLQYIIDTRIRQERFHS